MNWYLAKIVYQIICGEGDHTPQFDEQVRFIQAFSREHAFEKSRLIGLQEEETFSNQKQQLVQWKFVDIAELHDMDELHDGAEVYSQIRETDDADAYKRFIHHKARLLQNNFIAVTQQTL